MDKYDVAVLVLRIAFGASILCHGWNKVFSPSGLGGTAGWFASIGMKWPAAQARLAAFTEISAGALLASGLFTPLAAAVIISLMIVATVTVHWRVGYFIFLPNGGWEYCASIIAVCCAVCIAGPGSVSLDEYWDIPQVPAAGAVALGVVAAVCHLALSYRPSRT